MELDKKEYVDEDKPEEITLLEEIRCLTKESIKNELKTLKEKIRKECTSSVYDYAKKGKDTVFCIFEGPFFNYTKKYATIYKEEVEYWRNQGFFSVLKVRNYDYNPPGDTIDRVEIKISWEKGGNINE